MVYSIQRWMPFNCISASGIIKLKNNTYIKILKIIPINFDLKSDLEKSSILNSYKLFLKNYNFDIQIIIKSKKENLNEHLNKIKNKKKNENEKINKIIDLYINHIEKFNYINKSNAKQFYILINQIPEKNNKNSYEEELNEKYLKIKEGLSRCGNIVLNINKKEEIIEILKDYFLLNN